MQCLSGANTTLPRAAPWFLALLLAMSGMPVAHAHIDLTSHQSRHGRDLIKQGPCGMRGGERSENVYTYAPGETIMLEWDEFIPHPGYFRISFDSDGHDDFEDPADYFDYFTNEAVLLDGLHQHERSAPGTIWQQEVTLPDIECDNCTLQVVQMMTDKPPYVVGTNDLYYNCIDLVLQGGLEEDTGEVEDIGPAEDVGSDAGRDMGDDGPREDVGNDAGGEFVDPPMEMAGGESGCAVSVSSSSGSSGAVTLVVLLVAATWRRRP